MLVFFVVLVLIVILYLFIKRFSSRREYYRDLRLINLSNPDSAMIDIIDDPKEIIITNSKYAFYKKEIKRTDFIKIIKNHKRKKYI